MAIALASETTGEGPHVVLVHGFTQTGHSWATVAEDLARDHRVTVVDLPGHGGSADVQADLWDGADLLAETGGRATYVGYSLGARQCLHLALAHPDVVEGLVVLGGTAGIDDPTARAERRAADEELAEEIEEDGVDDFLERWLAMPLFAGLPETERSGGALAARQANPAHGLATSLRLTGTGTQDPPLWDRLGEVLAPTLVLAGEHDLKFAELGRRLAEGIPDARFAPVPDAGHAAHLERPAAFVAVLRAWLPGG
jgi:2-succinyl-6-hydroxy-2,4-cyclohexadiene-1-carboxylate synthase